MRPKKITEDAIKAEWDRLLAPTEPFVDDRGKTVNEIADMMNVSRPTAEYRVRSLVRAGQVACIGVRSTRDRSKVYDIVKPSSPPP